MQAPIQKILKEATMSIYQVCIRSRLFRDILKFVWPDIMGVPDMSSVMYHSSNMRIIGNHFIKLPWERDQYLYSLQKLRAVQVENGCFGDTKQGESSILYLAKIFLQIHSLVNVLQGHSGKTFPFTFSHGLDGFPRNARSTRIPFLMKMELSVDCVST